MRPSMIACAILAIMLIVVVWLATPAQPEVLQACGGNVDPLTLRCGPIPDVTSSIGAP